jgi:DNA-binding transcriptional LysR family regulator
MDVRTLRYFVAVAEELHFGRAARRLHMTQPPLSRAVKQLETDLGAALLVRSPAGVSLTAAGAALYDEARTLLAQADRTRARVQAAADERARITIGVLADSAEQAGTALAAAYRKQHPGVDVRIRETELTDPTAGLRAGLVDVALTRGPFDETGIVRHVLRSDVVGAVLRADDPMAGRPSLRVADLADHQWLQVPEGADPVWRAFWNGPPSRIAGPVVRTVHECMQAVLWNGSVGMMPLASGRRAELPGALVAVPLTDMPPSQLVVAWKDTGPTELIRSFVQIATDLCRHG